MSRAVCTRAQVQGLKESRLTIRCDEDQGLSLLRRFRQIPLYSHHRLVSNVFKYLYLSHTVQRLVLSKGAKRWILDDITRFSKYIWQMTIARSEYINKDDISISNLLKKTFSFCKHFGTVLTEEIRILVVKFCIEVFVMPKHLMTKLDIPEPSLYMSPLRAIVLSQQHCRITVIW